MSKRGWILLFLIITAVTGVIIYTRLQEGNKKSITTMTDTVRAVNTRIITSKNYFTAEQVGNIKRILIDSLKRILAPEFNNGYTTEKSSGQVFDSLKKEAAGGTVFTSMIDSVFVSKDSTGFITDSTRIKSAFISPKELSPGCIHLLKVEQKTYSRHKEILTTITNTSVVEKRKSFLERFKIAPNISAGIGIITKTFDVYAGVGICFEL